MLFVTNHDIGVRWLKYCCCCVQLSNRSLTSRIYCLPGSDVCVAHEEFMLLTKKTPMSLVILKFI